MPLFKLQNRIWDFKTEALIFSTTDKNLKKTFNKGFDNRDNQSLIKWS